MTDKIYGGYQPATMVTQLPPGRDTGIVSGAAANQPIENIISRTDQTIDRLFAMTDKLHSKLEVYMAQNANQPAGSDAEMKCSPYEAPNSAMGMTLYHQESRLRHLETALETMYHLIER